MEKEEFQDDELIELMLNNEDKNDKQKISEFLNPEKEDDATEKKKPEPTEKRKPKKESSDDDVKVMTKEDLDYMNALKRKIKSFKTTFSDEPEIKKINFKEVDAMNNIPELEAYYDELKKTVLGGSGGGIARAVYENGSNMVEDMLISRQIPANGMTWNALESGTEDSKKIVKCLKLCDIEYFQNFGNSSNPLITLAFLTAKNGANVTYQNKKQIREKASQLQMQALSEQLKGFGTKKPITNNAHDVQKDEFSTSVEDPKIKEFLEQEKKQNQQGRQQHLQDVDVLAKESVQTLLRPKGPATLSGEEQEKKDKHDQESPDQQGPKGPATLSGRKVVDDSKPAEIV